MKVLFIGGTGVISSACSRVAIEAGIQLFHLRRGKTGRQVPLGIKVLTGDVRDPATGWRSFEVRQTALRQKGARPRHAKHVPLR